MSRIAPPPPPATSRGAIAVFILGLCSFLALPLAVPTVIYGLFALAQIKRSSGRLKGRALIFSGLACGFAAVILWVPILGHYPGSVRDSRYPLNEVNSPPGDLHLGLPPSS